MKKPKNFSAGQLVRLKSDDPDPGDSWAWNVKPNGTDLDQPTVCIPADTVCLWISKLPNNEACHIVLFNEQLLAVTALWIHSI